MAETLHPRSDFSVAVRAIWTGFHKWWLPFWYGPSCAHGTFGPSYREGVVITCHQCIKEIDERIKAEQRSEQYATLRSHPAFIELERRVATLEDKPQETSSKERGE